MSTRRRRDRRVVALLTTRRWALLIVAALVAVVMLVPFYLLVSNAFKTGADYSQRGPLALPEPWTFSAFDRYLGSVDYPRLLTNSVLIAGVVAVVGVAVSMLSAYAIGIGRVRGRTWVVFVLLMATILPQEALIYPLFTGAQAVGLQNSVWSVVIIFIVLQAAFGTYLLSSVLGTFPAELLEAARVDGANRWVILTRIVAPVLRPTMSVLLVFFFVWTWNEFFIPMIMLITPDAQTIPIALAALKGQNTLDVTQLAAASLLSLLPTLVFFFLFQRTLTRGVTAGAVK
ncbi:carbohydrate ABC transporter permease [Jiangella anatolica]|uniref:ABC transporter permease n=1 Tax=Jiangella anatolica TaxID=2670374 RepID=A0A2W2C0N6_9ACTN|nr:carbohydrate ABC transporter permease [Jiangella anatolica]PZF86284.1 ABC transporter permease [Jiangella anatolica]